MIKMLQYKMYPAGKLRCPTTALVLMIVSMLANFIAQILGTDISKYITGFLIEKFDIL